MATLLDTPLTFFSKATPEQFAFVLGQYREIFKVHAQETRGAKKNGPAELIKLDNWYQDTLPQLIKGRKDQMLLYDEIVQVTKWKLLRGKFRPSILDLVKTNTETAVKNVTKKAFKKMPNINAAITALTQLKGIAPATASAILVAHSPDKCPYMADENMASTPGVEESDLSISEYMNYVEQVNICVERLRAQDTKTDWTPHKVELAMWALYQAKQHNSNLLDDMPTVSRKVSHIDEEQSPVSQENGKLDEDLESNEGPQVDEGVNSDRSESEVDENSNQSIEQRSETGEHLVNGSADDSQLSQPNGSLHSNKLNGNGIHDEESNQSDPVSSENEDKSNDSLLNHKVEDHSSDVQSTTPSSDLNNKESSVTSSSTVDNHHVEANAESSVPEESNQMEVTTSEPPQTANEAQAQEPMDSQPTPSVEKVEEELNNHQITSNHIEADLSDNATNELVSSVNTTSDLAANDNATSDKLEQHNHCNGTIKSCINNVFGRADTCHTKESSLKEHLISSSEENSNNNLSEENSNLSGSNLSYTDLHSTDNAIDDGPALKRIRVE